MTQLAYEFELLAASQIARLSATARAARRELRRRPAYALTVGLLIALLAPLPVVRLLGDCRRRPVRSLLVLALGIVSTPLPGNCFLVAYVERWIP